MAYGLVAPARPYAALAAVAGIRRLRYPVQRMPLLVTRLRQLRAERVEHATQQHGNMIAPIRS